MKLNAILAGIRTTASLCICFGLLAVQSVSASGKPYRTFTIISAGHVEQARLCPAQRNR